MDHKITPFLWFDSEAEEAMNFYVSLFKNARVLEVVRPEEGAPCLTVSFELEGQHFHAFNAGPMFKFTEAVSFLIDCEDQAEVDHYWNGFIDNGGEESQCGWLKDKWGLSWQVVPRVLMNALTNPDPVKTQRAVAAMMEMKKIIVADIEAAVA